MDRRWILAGLVVVGLVLCLVVGSFGGFVVGRWSAPRHNTATAAVGNTPPEEPNTEPNVEAASANYCPGGLYLIEGWSNGICGDANLIAAAKGLPKGEVQGPVKGRLIILSEYHDEHCYDDPTFWPLTEGVTEFFPVSLDKEVSINLPDGHWGLGGASECEVKVLEEKPLIADYCPQGLSPIPDWSIGICGDENIIAAAEGLPYGEVRSDNPIRGKLLILSNYQDEHCYGDKAAFWSHVEGVVGSYPVPLDEIVLVDLPAGHWGLGGATACEVCEKAKVPVVAPEPTPVVVPTAEPVDPCAAHSLTQIPDWSDGICGNQAMIDGAAGLPYGEIQDVQGGEILILGAFQDSHCYGPDGGDFWPLDEGVSGSLHVPIDEATAVNLAGHWGLGGATACQ